MKDSVYHSLLRISALTLALVLLFVSGIFSESTKDISRDTGLYLATAIGINAAVLPTEINTLSEQLLEKDKEIQSREIAVSLKEANANKSDTATFILSILLFVLLILIIFNYILDYIRTRKTSTVPISVYEQAH
jgi:galactitol-specific phosphotransferase system IIC component